ncbi:MAG TPA: mechanosensitive ion channel family protein [Flavipsychrobacter sp.]|nr:mechanosensitive ion channel family protein [Flavipsychrobacter sp.]
MNYLNSLSGIKIGGEPVIHIVWCAGIILFAILLKKPLAHLLTKFVGLIANRFSDRKFAGTFKALLHRPLELLLTTILFFIAINQLTVLLNTSVFSRFGETGKAKYAVRLIDGVDKLFLLLIIIFITLVISRIFDFVFHILINKAFEDDNREREQLFPLVKEVVKILVWTIGIFWILGTVFSVNIPALVTGLGIGGVAIALAAKESVENFFASFTILTDKPFRTGDSIRIGTYEGKVERVGFRSTRLRSVDGSEYIIPNKNIVGDNLENLTERQSRRVKVMVSIQYGVPYSELQNLIASLEEMLKQQSILTEKRDVLLDAFNENSFALSVIYNLPDPLPEGHTLTGVKHDINMKIYHALDSYLPSGVQKYQLIDANV